MFMLMQEEQYKDHVRKLRNIKPSVDSGLKKPPMTSIPRVRLNHFFMKHLIEILNICIKEKPKSQLNSIIHANNNERNGILDYVYSCSCFSKGKDNPKSETVNFWFPKVNNLHIIIRIQETANCKNRAKNHIISPSRHMNLQLQRKIDEENHLIIKKLLEIENKSVMSKKAVKLPSFQSHLHGFKSLNFSNRRNDYNRIKNENQKLISKLKNTKSAIDSMKLREHVQKQRRFKKILSQHISVSQMIENSRQEEMSYLYRYKIAYSSNGPPEGFLSSKNTPRFKRIADQMIKQESEHMISERIKNWKTTMFK